MKKIIHVNQHVINTIAGYQHVAAQSSHSRQCLGTNYTTCGAHLRENMPTMTCLPTYSCQTGMPIYICGGRWTTKKVCVCKLAIDIVI